MLRHLSHTVNLRFAENIRTSVFQSRNRTSHRTAGFLYRRSVGGIKYPSRSNGGQHTQTRVRVTQKVSLLGTSVVRGHRAVKRQWHFTLVINGRSGDSARELLRFFRFRLRLLARFRVRYTRQFVRRRCTQFVRRYSNSDGPLTLAAEGL